MSIHYYLFANGTFFSHRKPHRRLSLYDFVGPSSPVSAVLDKLALILTDPENAGAKHVQLLRLKLGPDHAAWPSRVQRALCTAAAMAYGLLWRKFTLHFSSYPWLLVPCFDSRLSQDTRRHRLEGFMKAAGCCLDKGLGAPLQKHCKKHGGAGDAAGVSQLCETPLARFLANVFERAVLTSTQAELLFRGMTHATLAGDKKLTLVGLSARTSTSKYRELVERWRAEKLQETPASSKCRPAWTKDTNPGSRTSALHAFTKELYPIMEAAGEFAALPRMQERFALLIR